MDSSLSVKYFHDLWNSKIDVDRQWDDLNGDERIEFVLSIINDPLNGWPATMKQMKQFEINAKWLINIIDSVHDYLCPNQYGTWQDRAKQILIKVKELSLIKD